MPDEKSAVKWLDILLKLLAAAVIPLFIWAVKLEVNRAVVETRLTQLEERITAAVAIDKTVQEQGKVLVRIETQMEAANTNLQELKSLLHVRLGGDQ